MRNAFLTAAKVILTIVISIGYLQCFGQDKLDVQFAPKPDTIKTSMSGNKGEYNFSQTIIIPRQKKNGRYRVSIMPDYDRSTVADSNVLIGKTDFNISPDSLKVDTFSTNILIKNDSLHERSLWLKLTVYDSAGNKTALCDKCKEKLIYFEKYKPIDSTNMNHEFWLFVGTNLDLVDGVQAQDLYFRADYLSTINKRNWFFVSLGKDRYFDYTDSVYGVPYGSVKYPAVRDSLSYTTGHFTALYASKTENLFLNLKHLFKLSARTKVSVLFLESGIDLSYLTNTRFLKGVTINDSSTSKVPAPAANMPSYFPYILSNFNPTVEKSWSYNFSTGLMHVFNQDDLNIKTQLIFGVNYTQYPKTSPFNSIGGELDQYTHSTAFFTRFRIDATVLNPGISFGFEVYTAIQKSTDFQVTYINGDQKFARPLFNISLTKVLDVRHIKSLFAGVTPITATN